MCPPPALSKEAGSECELPAFEIHNSATNADTLRNPGRGRHHPQPRLALGERFVGEHGMLPDAAIDSKDASLTHV